jgi:hypothetical protein
MFTELIEEDFFYDNFFVSQDATDPGKEVMVTIRGREVPIRIKRGLSLEDREAAKAQAITKRIKPDGTPEIVKLDEGVFAIELIVRNVLSWPFRHRNGSKVPITRENIKAMVADGADALATTIMKSIQGQVTATANFTSSSEPTSEEVSSEAGQLIQ